MKRWISLAVVALLLPMSASAKDLTGRLGFGYFDSDAPVGIRYWVNEKVGIDLGIGLDATDLGSTTATSFWVEAGVPYVAYATERANFFVRVGATLGLLDDRVFGTGNLDERWTTVDLFVGPGAEVFFGDHFSLQATHGIGVEIMSPPDAVSSETMVNIVTSGSGVSQLGFHFYF